MKNENTTITKNTESYNIIRYDFLDYNNNECYIYQKQNTISNDELPFIKFGEGIYSIYLTQEHVKQIIPILQKFADTGKLS